MRSSFIISILAVAAVLPLSAEEKTSIDNVYRVDFTIHETTLASQPKDRHYSLLLEPNSWGKISAGSKVPYTVEKDKFNYADVGVIISCRLREKGPQVSMDAKFEVSSTMNVASKMDLSAELKRTPGGNMPLIQSVRSEMSAPIPLAAATRVVTLDDPSADRHYEITVAITKI